MPTAIPEHLKPEFAPLVNQDAVIQLDKVRFSILTARTIRLEYSSQGIFENRPSQTFWFRQQPTPEFSVFKNDLEVRIETDHLIIHYMTNDDGFTPENLSIQIKNSNFFWQHGDQDNLNLLGTTRTLDRASGKVTLEPGLLSRSGWSVVDDSNTLVFNPDGWLEPRHAPSGTIDQYFFGFGKDYQSCLDDFSKIAGKVPLLPRWVLGNWWSRYWAYTQEELMTLMLEFEAHQIPLSVCIVDMDWHITNTGNECSGWTGYSWNKDLFPDPEGFIAFLHSKGLKTALNLHPAEGIHPHEAMYPKMAARLGIDPQLQEPIKFEIADADFTEAYFEVLHHPYESMGIDFWWIDWQQGLETGLPGLDPLWWLNHLHFYDLGRDLNRRPFIFSRWGGYGTHRYPLGFSGDTVANWESLTFQPYFTATASNVAYGWWSHDIGGHMGGIEDRELYTRWVQFGVFSPILRLHSTNNPFHERLPWGFDAEILRITKLALQFRHQLIPYIYSMAWRNHEDDVQLIQPMYHRYPDQEEAYYCPQQYLFGSELIAAPYTSPADDSTGLSRQIVWLPEGDWHHFFSGEYYAGNAWYAIYGKLEDIPVFAKAGAIVPLSPEIGWGSSENPAELELHIFAGADNVFHLYEDDGQSTAYLENHSRITTFEHRWSENKEIFRIHPFSGDQSQVPEKRAYNIYIHGVRVPDQSVLVINDVPRDITSNYHGDTGTFQLETVELTASDTLELMLTTNERPLLSKVNRKQECFFEMLKSFKLNTRIKHMIYNQYELLQEVPAVLDQVMVYLEEKQIIAILEVLHQVGVHQIDYTPEEFIVLWNNRQDPQFRYKSTIWVEGKWLDQTRAVVDQGEVPKYLLLIPSRVAAEFDIQPPKILNTRWNIRVDYLNQLSLEYRNPGDNDIAM